MSLALDPSENVVKAFSDHCPDVLLMDVHLSRQNGLEILDLIRASTNGCNARIIMTSGLDVKDDCMKRGADGFILKPFMPDDLIKMLKGK